MPVLLSVLDDADMQVRVVAWEGVQSTMRGLFPSRRFDFGGLGYDPRANSRAAALAQLRSWWAAAK